MSFRDILVHVYLPLLTQETAVMVSTFTYALKTGASWPLLALVNTIAVATDLVIFFLPTHFLSARLHTALTARFQNRYDTGMNYVIRFGAFKTAFLLGFVMPSVAAMIVVGLLHLPFRRALAGLFLGSAVYVVVPLGVALPLAPIFPRFLLPLLPWIGPGAAILFLLVALYRWGYGPPKARAES
jgi:branched-subunit amino acid transport protein AzlD